MAIRITANDKCVLCRLHCRRIPATASLARLNEVFARLESPSILGGNIAKAQAGRFSCWAAEPKEEFIFDAGQINPFEDLDRILNNYKLRRDSRSILPKEIFCGGWIRLREGISFSEVLKAMFSGGSITGASKKRVMEIIDETEPTARGVYTGSIGFIGIDGNACLNIAIRTMIIENGKAFVQAGGGIVADSEPKAEWQETITKAKALLAGIQATQEDSGKR